MQGAQHITAEATAVDAPYVGQSFRTDDEAQEYYTNFARKNGFAIRRERSKGNPAHPLGVYKRELVCHRAGVSLPRKTVELKRQRNKKSSRCRCEAQMIIKKNVLKGTTCWIVVHFSNEHNHQLLDSEEVRHLPAYRNIPPAVRERILFLSKAGCTVNLMMRALEMERGAKPGHLTFTERDLRNFLQANKGIDRETEGSELLKACKAMRDKSSDFRYDYTLDANQKLEHIAWSYPDGVHAYKVFGDVVIFDTTYRLYAYDRPFGVWFGVDNYGNLIFLGCVLLQDERPASFRWALQVLMDGKFPQTIMTDLDMGLREAMMSELPNTKHAFGICGYNYRSQALRSLSSIIIQESSVTKDRFNYVQWHMSKLLTHVRNMPTVDEAVSDMETVTSVDTTVSNRRSRARLRKVKSVVEMPNEAQELSKAQTFSETLELSELP
ncbi:hypothetical protein B296_00021020 [Ensete ventricosum]|uniref:Protein FAR1-RELATED SEQUENCE n=1 Tax=Ensete ventricosum TaxID=4639 RepID=A0A427AGC9_ENSVE|nr:hypothetical protein B296_00021020 [Ensete ventricosum]